jgi:adenosylhomocysteinase
MENSRIANPNLAEQIDEKLLTWIRHITPITGYYADQIVQRDYRGKRLAFWGHITGQNTLLMMAALKQAGAEIILGACNVDSTDDVAAAYAVSR